MPHQQARELKSSSRRARLPRKLVDVQREVLREPHRRASRRRRPRRAPQMRTSAAAAARPHCSSASAWVPKCEGGLAMLRWQARSSCAATAGCGQPGSRRLRRRPVDVEGAEREDKTLMRESNMGTGKDRCNSHLTS